MPYALREGDRVNVYIGCGKYADVETGTIVIHNKEEGYWSSRPYLVRFDNGVEDWFDYTSLTKREDKK